jgi:hypothetical protein
MEMQYTISLTVVGNISQKHAAIISHACTLLDSPEKYTEQGRYKAVKLIARRRGLFMPNECPNSIKLELIKGEGEEVSELGVGLGNE